MITSLSASLAFMTSKERRWWYFLTGCRALLSTLDLIAIMAIGFVATSTAVFLTSGSEPGRVLEFAGVQVPAVTAQTLPLVSSSVLLLFVTKAFFSILLTKKAAFFVATVEARSAKTIAELSFGGDLGRAREQSREEIMFAVQLGSPAAFNTLLNAANTFLSEAVLFFLICLAFLAVDPAATLAAVIYFGLVGLIMQYFVGSLMLKAGKVSAEATVQANAAISDLFSVFRELLVLGKRESYISRIYRARIAAADSSATQYYLAGMPRYIIEVALLVGVALFVLAQALAGDVVRSAATLGVFLAGGFRLTAALLPLQNALLTIKGALPAAKTAHDILEHRRSHESVFGDEEKGGVQPRHAKSSLHSPSPIGIRLECVSYSYPESLYPALREVSLTVQAGTQVALMGPSGAGKSTIADLLCSVLAPSSGSIIHTDQAGDVLDSENQGRVSYIPQRPGLVSGTILENIALGEDVSKVNRPRALHAIRLAHLLDLVDELPDGLDTPLGKLQDGLSGGQMQRLGLARALYTNPGLLIMDEVTSALDAESEAEIQKALDAMRGEVTVVLIAHRLNTIQHADKVFLVEDGQVRDSGTLKELIARNPSVERVVDLMKVEKD